MGGCSGLTKEPIQASQKDYFKDNGMNLTIAVTSRPSHLIMSHIVAILLKVRKRGDGVERDESFLST